MNERFKAYSFVSRSRFLKILPKKKKAPNLWKFVLFS